MYWCTSRLHSFDCRALRAAGVGAGRIEHCPSLLGSVDAAAAAAVAAVAWAGGSEAAAAPASSASRASAAAEVTPRLAAAMAGAGREASGRRHLSGELCTGRGPGSWGAA